MKPAFDHPDSHSYEGDIAVPVPAHHVEVHHEVVSAPVHVVQPEVLKFADLYEKPTVVKDLQMPVYH